MKKGWSDIEISKLIKADWNYKEENTTLTKKLTENIKRNGQIESIMIRELDTGFYEVVNGNHRIDVMRALKLKKAHCYNFGKISQAQASRIAIETNETHFKSDPLKLSELIKDLTEDFKIEELEKTMPYDIEELNNMLSITEFDWEEFATQEIDSLSDDKFNKSINLKVSEETFKSWLELKDRMKNITGYDNESKVFEFAVIETLNIPLKSLQ